MLNMRLLIKIINKLVIGMSTIKDKIEENYWESYYKFKENCILTIKEERYYTSSGVGLQKRSGRRVGMNAIKTFNRYPTHLLLEDKYGNEVWVDIKNDLDYGYAIGKYSYKEYQKERKETAQSGCIAFLLIGTLLIAAFFAVINNM